MVIIFESLLSSLLAGGVAFPGAFLGVIFLGVALRWSFLGVVNHLPSFLGVVDVEHLPSSFLGVGG